MTVFFKTTLTPGCHSPQNPERLLMQLGYTILYVPNVPETLAFYESALGLKRRFLHESNQYAELETGQTTLALAANALAVANGTPIQPATPSTPAPPVTLSFITDNPAEAYTHATQHGAIPMQPEQTKPWGQRTAYLRDPNGTLIELCTLLS